MDVLRFAVYKLLELKQNGSGGNLIAGAEVERGNDAVGWGTNGVLHLHGFEDEQRVASADHLPIRDEHGAYLAGHGRGEGAGGAGVRVRLWKRRAPGERITVTANLYFPVAGIRCQRHRPQQVPIDLYGKVNASL